MQSGRTPLHFAAKYGNTSVAELLIKRKAQIDAHIKVTPSAGWGGEGWGGAVGVVEEWGGGGVRL